MADYAIEKKVPLPRIAAHRGRKYPFPSMDVNDSFFVPYENRHQEPRRLVNKVSNAACHFVRYWNLNWRFSCRQTKDGVRCWRVK